MNDRGLDRRDKWCWFVRVAVEVMICGSGCRDAMACRPVVVAYSGGHDDLLSCNDNDDGGGCAQIVWLDMFCQLGRYKTDHLFTDTEGTIEAITLSMIESNCTCMV